MSDKRVQINVTRGDEVAETKPQEKAFSEMQKTMEDEMERRRQDWEKEVEQLQGDFFNVQATDQTYDVPRKNIAVTSSGALGARLLGGDTGISGTGIGGTGIGGTEIGGTGIGCGTDIIDINNAKTLFNEEPDGTRKWKMRFNLTGFDPLEINVKAEANRLTVTAKHETDVGNKRKATKQFNRQVDIPANVDPEKVLCYFSDDNILSVEAPVEDWPLVQARTQVDIEAQPMRYISLEGPSASTAPHYSSVVSNTSGRRPGPGFDAPVRSYVHPVILEEEDGKRLKLDLPLGASYEPEDVVVTYMLTKIRVQARHEENIGGRSSKMEFSRDFDLPESIEPGTLRASLTDYGNLLIGASSKTNADHDLIVGAIRADMPFNTRHCRIEGV